MMDEQGLRGLLEEQTRYYRSRAATYDLDMAWDSDDPELVERLAPVDGWFARLPIRGQVLELACGTGAWTRRLAARADHVHAIDVAPEMIERAAERMRGAGNATFEVADLYRWQPPAAYDVVFFSFLLTHVPPDLSSSLWQLVSSSLAHGGTVAFVDAAPNRHEEEDRLARGVVRRTLRDGSVHRIVKVFPTPDELVASMAAHGLDATVDVVNDAFLVGTGRR
jgi:trans-aconitate methyltransferase